MQPGAAGARRWVKRLQPCRSALYDIFPDRRADACADARADLCTDPLSFTVTHAISELITDSITDAGTDELADAPANTCTHLLADGRTGPGADCGAGPSAVAYANAPSDTGARSDAHSDADTRAVLGPPDLGSIVRAVAGSVDRTDLVVR